MMKKLQEIEGFATKVGETKRLADELAMNFARMKEAINKTVNESFAEIANQIDTLRKNMEQMEAIDASAPKVMAPAPEATPTPTPTPTPAPEVTPAPTEEVAPTPEPQVETTPEPTPAPETTPEPTPAPTTEPEVVETPPSESSDQMDFLLQQKDRLKASLTDLRFDYMRGYIPEDEYKTKESELDTQLEDVDKQIAALK